MHRWTSTCHQLIISVACSSSTVSYTALSNISDSGILVCCDYFRVLYIQDVPVGSCNQNVALQAKLPRPEDNEVPILYYMVLVIKPITNSNSNVTALDCKLARYSIPPGNNFLLSCKFCADVPVAGERRCKCDQ